MFDVRTRLQEWHLISRNTPSTKGPSTPEVMRTFGRDLGDHDLPQVAKPQVEEFEDGLHCAPDRNNYPEAYRIAYELDSSSTIRSPQKAPSRDKLLFGLPRLTFCLGLGLFISATFAIVAAAVIGSLLHTKSLDLSQAQQQLATCAAHPSQNTTTSSPSSSTSSCSHDPSSSCLQLNSPYTNPENVKFTLQCNKDFPLQDLLGVYVYEFEDCLNACASYNAAQQTEDTHSNSSCAGVSYAYTLLRDNTAKWSGNCFLKAKAFDPSSSIGSANVDSAFLNTD